MSDVFSEKNHLIDANVQTVDKKFVVHKALTEKKNSIT